MTVIGGDDHAAFLAALPQPEAVVETGKPPIDGPKNDLDAVVSRYIAGQYTIVNARYFRVKKGTNWPQLSTSFYSKQHHSDSPIKPGGGPDYPTWAPPSPANEPGAYMMIDFYPAAKNAPDYIVTMSRKALPDGTQLVGFYALKAAAK